MKRIVLLVTLVAATLCAPLASAQSCGGMYTYQDSWVDDNGNVVAENYTDGDSSCADYIAYSDVSISLPSGYFQSNAASASCCAESITSGPQPNFTDTGTIDGNNQITDSCGALLFSGFFGFDFTIALTKSKVDFTDPATDSPSAPGSSSVKCVEAAWCTQATSPPACNPNLNIQRPLIAGSPSAVCASFYISHWLAEKNHSDVFWNCFPIIPGDNAEGTSDASLGVCKKQ